MSIDNARCLAVVRLGLITTLYFRNGHAQTVRERLDGCFQRFYQAFRAELKCQFFQHRRTLSASGFATCRRQAVKRPAEQPLLWSLSSCGAEQAAVYSLFVMAASRTQGENDLSCLKMVLPWSYLTEPDGLRNYEAWIRYLCSAVQAEHGFGGLACVLPTEGHRYLPLEYQLACRYSGLMVDPVPHIDSLRLLRHIKGVSWYTVLGHSFVKRLGGNDALRARSSSWSDVQFQAYDGGLLIRAGLVPDLGDVKAPLPRAYVRVNRLISPVRLQDTGCLHPYLPSDKGFTRESTARWYARFDDEPVQPVNAGQACPQGGYWFSNARAGSRRLFCEGELMPGFAGVKAERTQWFLDPQQDAPQDTPG
ncbi:DUF3396 domain-containing protein [Pseudomonas syringae]